MSKVMPKSWGPVRDSCSTTPALRTDANCRGWPLRLHGVQAGPALGVERQSSLFAKRRGGDGAGRTDKPALIGALCVYTLILIMDTGHGHWHRPFRLRGL